LIYVLDACAILAYLWDEPGANVVEDRLTEPGSTGFAHVVNLCEVYYKVLRKSGVVAADGVLQVVAIAGVIAREDIDTPFWKDVGSQKSQGGISLADCFAVALTRRTAGTLVTTDHGELERIAAEGICPVRFIR
jgi:PIN domain nuclease of toxin-antitoxin system